MNADDFKTMITETLGGRLHDNCFGVPFNCETRSETYPFYPENQNVRNLSFIKLLKGRKRITLGFIQSHDILS